MNKVIHGDCLELMKDIPDGSIDMILCDLPYGTTQNKWDVIIPFDKLWEQYERIIKINGAIILTANQPFTSALIMSNPKLFKQALCWKKNISSNFLNANRIHMAIHEDVIVFYKKYPTFNKQLKEGKSYLAIRKDKDDTGECYGKINKQTITDNKGTRNPTTVLEYPVQREGFHPTQKPVELFKYLIKTYTNEGDTVLDNCAGSGTTGIACLNTKRNYILMEKEEKYFEIINKRIAEWHLEKQPINCN